MHLFKHRRSYLNYRPRGVALIISPWNFPFSIPFGEVVMALLAGNTVVLKPSSLTPLIALKGRELFDEAGLPADVFQVVPCAGKVGGAMIEMGVDYVSFTGLDGGGHDGGRGVRSQPDSLLDGARGQGPGDRVAGCRP